MSDNCIEELLSLDPYQLDMEQKNKIFMNAMKEALSHHISNNTMYKALCESQNFSLNQDFQFIEDIPYIPVKIFKNKDLSSVPKNEIKATLNSSATSGIPSTINIDSVTAKRQSIASAKVMANFLGDYRRPFIILDENPKNSRSLEMKARTAATLGFLVLANSADYMLESNENNHLNLNVEKFQKKINSIVQEEQEVCIFGFTFILYYHLIRVLKEMNLSFQLPENSKIVHIGGWKKLESQKTDKSTFLKDIELVLGIPSANIIDFYGFTEQMGLVYPNKGLQAKITAAYSEIIIRDFQTLSPAKDGQEGLIQILTPIPHSYPGISILTEDVGKILSRNGNLDGRLGTQFEIIGRAKEAEVRGCGDIMSEYVT